MGFKKFVIEKEDEELAQELDEVTQKINDFLKNIERDDITDEAIHDMAEELEMEPSELEVVIYKLYKDKLDEESEEEELENGESEEEEEPEQLELEPDEEENSKLSKVNQNECKGKNKNKKSLIVTDSEVINAFYKKEPMSGNKLKSTGRELQYIDENVVCIAKWNGPKFTVLENFLNIKISKIVRVLKENCSYFK